MIGFQGEAIDLAQQQIVDAEHLKLLRWGYLFAGALESAIALFPLIHVTIGLFLLFGSYAAKPADPNAKYLAYLFIGIGASLSCLFAILATLKFLAARAIKQRRSRTFLLIVAAITCLGIPYGTILGVATFLVLSRPTVEALFDQRTASVLHGPIERSS